MSQREHIRLVHTKGALYGNGLKYCSLYHYVAETFPFVVMCHTLPKCQYLKSYDHSCEGSASVIVMKISPNGDEPGTLDIRSIF